MGDRGVKKNFLKFYLNPTNLTEEETGEILLETGIDVSATKIKLDNLIKKSKAEVKLKQGEKFKNLYLKLKEVISKSNDKDFDCLDPDLKFAYRKLKDNPNLNPDKFLSESQKLKLIEEIIKNESKDDLFP